MSFGTPKNWERVCTFRDDSLPHQIKLVTNGSRTFVSCNCIKDDQHLAEVSTATEALRIWKEHRARAEGSEASDRDDLRVLQADQE